MCPNQKVAVILNLVNDSICIFLTDFNIPDAFVFIKSGSYNFGVEVEILPKVELFHHVKKIAVDSFGVRIEVRPI